MRGVLVVLVAGSCAGLLAAPALASSNAASTQSYLQANYALVRVARSHESASENGPLEVLAQVRGECPGVGAGSPQNGESTQMSDDVIGAMVLAAAKPDVAAIRTFIHAVSALSWTSASLTTAVHGYAHDLEMELSLSPPNLCAEVKQWAADGYQKLPATASAFVAKFMPAWVGIGELPGQLAHFENAGERALAHRTAPVEVELAEGEARAVEHWGEIMDTLKLWP
jgi:hypothetical protein